MKQRHKMNTGEKVKNSDVTKIKYYYYICVAVTINSIFIYLYIHIYILRKYFA